MLQKLLLLLVMCFGLSLSSKSGYFENDRYVDVIKSGEKIETMSIDVVSLGRSADLGDFYDMRTDSFPGISLYSPNFTKESIHSIDNPYANVDYIRTETVSEKISKLNIEANLAVSALFGLITIFKGSGSYLKEDKQTFESTKISLVYKVRTKTEILKMFTDNAKSLMDVDLLDVIDATHVVAGIDWGADIVVSLEETSTDSSTKTEVSGMMGGALQGIASGIAGAAGMGFDAENLEKRSTFSIIFNGDVTPDILPQTFNDSIKFLTHVPDLIEKVNDGKGKQMNYILIPIDTVRQVMKLEGSTLGIYQEIDDASLNGAIDLYQELKNCELLIKDVYAIIKEWRFLAPDDFTHIKAIKSSFDAMFMEVQHNISNSVVGIRSRKLSRDTLPKILTSYTTSNWTVDDVTQTLTVFNKTLDKIKTLSLWNNARFIDRNLQEILIQNYKKEIRTVSVDLDTLNVSSPVFDRIKKLLEDKPDEIDYYYIEHAENVTDPIITSYLRGEVLNRYSLLVNEKEYLLVKDGSGFVTIIDATTYDYVNSYQLPEIGKSIITVINNTFYNIDILSGTISSAKVENLLFNVNITWVKEGSFPAEDNYVQSNIVLNGTDIFFVTQSGILYRYDSVLKATTRLDQIDSTGNYVSLVAYKNSLYIHKDTHLYEYDGNKTTEIMLNDFGLRQNCGLLVIGDRICRLGGNITDLYPDSLTCYDVATQHWTTYGELAQPRHSPGIVYTFRGTLIIGGEFVHEISEIPSYWLSSVELFFEDFKSWSYVPSSFPNGLKEPQGVRFYY